MRNNTKPSIIIFCIIAILFLLFFYKMPQKTIEDNTIIIINESFTGLCYQEFANLRTTCGGLSTGSYYTTVYGIGEGGFFFINYSKPARAKDAIWQVKRANIIENISIPSSCFNMSRLQLRIESYLSTGFVSWSEPECFDGTNWLAISNKTPLAGNYGGENSNYSFDGDWGTGSAVYYGRWSGSSDAGGTIFEEAIYWNMGA